MDESGALAGYWRFFETFNTRDAYTFSSAMSYPHVRVSWAKYPTVLADMEAHALSVGWDRFIETGWDHTVGKEPKLIGMSESKAHIVGGWTRYTKDEQPILSNLVCYIVTRVNDQWGIQCRFGTDSGGESIDKNSFIGSEVTEITREFIEGSNNRDITAQWEHTTDEIFVIGAGKVDRIYRDDDHLFPNLGECEIEAVYLGLECATMKATSDQGEALPYLVKENDLWKVQAGSWL